MPTCKDCFHFSVCKTWEIHINEETGKIAKMIGCHSAPIHIDNMDSVDCTEFKEAAKLIELPCKVGQMIYRICPVPKGKGCMSCPWEYCGCHDIGYQKDRPNTIREEKARDFAWIIKRMPYFGRIYFLTREEAEQALKGRNNKCAKR